MSDPAFFYAQLGALMNLTEPPCRKLYAVVRRDLPEGLRAAQMAHAVAGLVQFLPEATRRWQSTDNYLIVLEVRDEAHLREMIGKVLHENVSHFVWHEIDLGNAATAFAAFPEPHMNGLFAELPLAYKPRLTRWQRIRRNLW